MKCIVNQNERVYNGFIPCTQIVFKRAAVTSSKNLIDFTGMGNYSYDYPHVIAFFGIDLYAITDICNKFDLYPHVVGAISFSQPSVDARSTRYLSHIGTGEVYVTVDALVCWANTQIKFNGNPLFSMLLLILPFIGTKKEND
jgi:hypothetical protein